MVICTSEAFKAELDQAVIDIEKETGNRPHPYMYDVLDNESITAMINKVAEDLGGIYGLVNHCPGPKAGTFEALTEADWADGQLSVRIRYRSRPIPCSVRQVKNRFPEEGGGEDLWLVRFKEKASAVTPGQSAVFYVGDKMAGGAYIGSQRGLQAYLED